MRKIKIASFSMFNNYTEPKENSPSVERNMGICCKRLQTAGELKTDIVCTPECCLTIGTDMKPGDIAEEIPGRISERYAEMAAMYRMYVLGWLYEKKKGKIYNSLVLFDRKGEVAGVYRKIHITTGEASKGICSGNGFKTFKTDFGTISAVICFDGFFQESFQIPALKGAEIIFYSLVGSWSDYIAGEHLENNEKSEELWLMRTRTYAYTNSVYIVASGCCWQSNVITPSAEIIATNHKKKAVKWNVEKVVTAEIDLDREFYFDSGNELGRVPRKKYLSSERHVFCYKELCNPKFPARDKNWIKQWRSKKSIEPNQK